MCRTETRVRDFRSYAEATDYVQTGGAYVLNFRDDDREWEFDANASWEKHGFTQSEDHPVVCVSWEEARAMAVWLSKVEKGLTYNLATDADWSAAVGSDSYPWGNAWPPPEGAGNYFGKEGPQNLLGSGGKNENDNGAGKIARVASYNENRFGFFDLGGNVWEWCADVYKASMNEAEALEALPVLKNEQHLDGVPFRVVRGGSWLSYDEFGLYSSSRNPARPSERNVCFGFRLVVAVGVGG
jgi:formylglycine-generating enzyme required for sulfatase activity